jgi:hypothetical protein
MHEHRISDETEKLQHSNLAESLQRWTGLQRSDSCFVSELGSVPGPSRRPGPTYSERSHAPKSSSWWQPTRVRSPCLNASASFAGLLRRGSPSTG